MALTQLAAPDLAPLSVGSATLLLLEGLGFSANGQQLLVRATFTDSADPSALLHYGMWFFDMTQQSYGTSLNALLAPAGGTAADVEVRSAQFVGTVSNFGGVGPQWLAESAPRSTVSTSLSTDITLAMGSGVTVQQADVVAGVLGSSANLHVEDYNLSADGRFLAIQTDTAWLAPGSAIDTNGLSDIYLLDLPSKQVERVSFAGGAEAFDPAQLGNVTHTNGQVQVAFSSTGAFAAADQNSGLTSAINLQPANDAYVWRSTTTASGLAGDASIQLVSARPDGSAVGMVLGDAGPLVTDAGVYFTSYAPDLVANDSNQTADVFLANAAGSVSRVGFAGVDQASSGTELVAATPSGLVLALTTISPELIGTGSPAGLPQIVTVSTETQAWSLAGSSSGAAPDNMALYASLRPDGSTVALSSTASNLSPDLAPALQGSAYIESTGLQTTTQVDVLAYTWKQHTLLEGAQIQVGVDTFTTDATGHTPLTLADASAATVSLSATRAVPTAEATATHSAVNLQDAIAILKMIVGLDVNGAGKPLSPYQTLAADFDGNGAVGLTDAVGVLKHVVGLTAPDPAWKFVNETEASPSATSAPGVDLNGATGPLHVGLVGYLSGDVDGSFTGAAGASSLDSSYFTTLIEVHPELNLSQFGIYNTVPV